MIKSNFIFCNNILKIRLLCKEINILKYSAPCYQNYIKIKKMEENLKVRPNPVVTVLDTPEFKAIFTNNLYDLINVFKKYKYELRIAGGPVRDLLMKKTPTDFDFATTATPAQMKEMFIEENIRMINRNGEKHGTITPRINDENFEVTTLRIDVVTDGRHAEVQFTTDWQLDANRRDLTVNSMFLGFDGTVYDYFYGFDDLLQRRVAFVGTPDLRIKEDFLRILRYFRFYGRIADKPNSHDQTIIDTIKNNISGLERISGERIWGELKKILQGKFGTELMITLLECGAAKYIGLPETPNIDEFKRVSIDRNLYKQPILPITLLSSLLSTTDESLALHKRLKLSAYERDLSIFLMQNKSETGSVEDLITYQQMCLSTQKSPNLIKEYVLELLKYNNKKSCYDHLLVWQIPSFPIKYVMLETNGCPAGKTVGLVMRKLKYIWIQNEFKYSSEELLKYLPDVLEKINCKKPKLE